MRTMEKVVGDLEALAAEAASFVAGLHPAKESATLVTLEGELGAGKTAFVKAAAKALRVDELVTSPTFVLEKIYQLASQPFARLVHIDAYRFDKGSDLAPLGFNELMKDTHNLVMLEWPERVRGALPKPAHALMLTTLPDGSRKIAYG